MPIEQVSPGLERIIGLDQEVEWLASGFGGDGSALGVPWWPAEGPVWFQEGGYLLFSDIGGNRRMRYNDADGLTEFQLGTNEANGLTRDPQGPPRAEPSPPNPLASHSTSWSRSMIRSRPGVTCSMGVVCTPCWSADAR